MGAKSRKILLFLLLVAWVMAGCRLANSAPPTAQAPPEEVPAAGPVLQDLESLEQFREMFNQDIGRPRLLLLLSPT